MIYAQAMKKVALEPASFTNGATASVVIDRLGFDYATIDIQLGSGNTTSNVPAISLQESDTTDATNYSTITAFNTTACAISAIGTNSVKIVTLDVDCKARKRYLKPIVVPVTTEVIGIMANLSRAEKAPTTTGEKNVAVNVIG